MEIAAQIFSVDCSNITELVEERNVSVASVAEARISPVEVTSAARADPVPLHETLNVRSSLRSKSSMHLTRQFPENARLVA